MLRPRLYTCLLSFTLMASQHTLVVAQEKDNSHGHSSLTYDLTTEGAVGGGSYTAYYVSANRHGVMSNEANTGYIGAAMHYGYERGNWCIEAGLDMQTQPLHAYSHFYLQQLYASASWRWLTLCAGAREINPVLRDFSLSSGSTVWSGNSRPIPQVLLGTKDFVAIPGTRHWLNVYLDISYGRFMDNDYLTDHYATYSQGRKGQAASFLTTDVWYHHKQFYLRSNPEQHLVATIGLEHAVQFGGKAYNTDFDGKTFTSDVTIKDFFDVLIPKSGDSSQPTGDQAFVYGNHLGNISALAEYQWGGDNDRQHRAGLYVENFFEDGSGMAKRNGWDGLWGIEYHNSQRNAPLHGVVFEYLQTTDQSGPIHWDPADYVAIYGQAFGQGEARGNDDYYNNYFYDGYSHYGQSCGTPMLKSPIYNDDGYLRFTDNRIRAWHLGLEGTLWESIDRCPCCHSQLTWRLLASYRNSWGTHFTPAEHIRHSFDTMAELGYHWRQWQFRAAYAMDLGSLYGNNYTFNFSIKYHGILL